jgi:hypothetical protein
MKHRFSMTLLDISGEMLSVSETTNPECEHVRGDMRTVRLAWCASPVDPRVMSYAALARADLP